VTVSTTVPSNAGRLKQYLLPQTMRLLAGVLLLSIAGCSSVESARIVDAQTGKPLANALVVLTEFKQPFFAGLFADGLHCEKIAFSRTDSDGKIAPVTGILMRGLKARHVVADGYRDIKVVGVEKFDGRYVLRIKEMSALTDSQQIGPQYSTRSEADAALAKFLATPDGPKYDTFTIQRAGEGHTNWAHLRANWVELARFNQTFATESEAEQMWKATRFALGGAPDVDAFLSTFARCYDARLGEEAMGIEVLRKIESLLPLGKRTSDQQQTLGDFAARLDTRLSP
jgi:hypothetical protein